MPPRRPPSPPAVAPDLSQALDRAMAGHTGALFDRLSRGSGLPGPRVNAALADAFADLCLTHGSRADAVALAMLRLSADEAPGATPLEFLPACAAIALGARAAADESARPRLLRELHAHADDLRFRVRDAVVEALARVGARAGDALVGDVASWMDGYFHAAAVLRALGLEPWLTRLHDPAPVVARMNDAFALAREAPRAAARYPGRKALVEALAEVPARIATRFGMPVFDLLVDWTRVQDPELRDAIGAVLRDGRLAGRFGPEVARVREALVASLPAPRNPDHDFGPTRGRGRKRAHKRRS